MTKVTLSKYINKEKALDELDKKKELELEAMFKLAAKDESNNEESKEWIDSVNLNDIEGWEFEGLGQRPL